MHQSLSFAEESGIVAGSLGMIPTRRSDPSRHLPPAWLNFVAQPTATTNTRPTTVPVLPSAASRPNLIRHRRAGRGEASGPVAA